jgi:DNA repair protein RadD
VRIEQLLSRADDEVLEQLIGGPAARLLNLLDPSLARPRSLRSLISNFRTAEELLRDPKTRSLLLDLLPKADAESLAAALGCRNSDPFEFLRGVRIPKGSRTESVLFEMLAVVATDRLEEQSSSGKHECTPAYPLFDHQRIAARLAWETLERGPNRVLLHMPTGSGKTRTAMHIVARELRERGPKLVVWLAYSEELCEQAAGEFQRAWSHLGDRILPIHRYWGARELSIGDATDGLVVAGLAKTYAKARSSIEFIARLADRTTLVIIDEAHQAIAPTYRFVLEVLVDRNQGTKLLGLSATPGRTWNEPDKDRALADFFAQQKVTLAIPGYANPIDYLIEQGYLAKPSFETLEVKFGPELTNLEIQELANELEVPPTVLRKLAEDERRNLLIVRRIEKLTSQHKRILVFAATVEHAQLLSAVLSARGIEAAAVTASTPPVERHRLITRFKSDLDRPIVMCNYGVLTTGFDAPRTSAAVIARPTKSLVLFSQMVGRATRGPRAGGNSSSLIVSVVDTSLPGFSAMGAAFTNWEDVW